MRVFRPLLRAGARLYRRLFRRRLDARTRDVAARLRRVPALSHLSSGALYAMAEVTHRRTYRRGEALYYEGDPGLGLYIVESGRLRLLTNRDPDCTCELRTLEENEMIGAVSLLGHFRRLETAETMTEAQVLGFFRPDLKNVMRHTPTAGAEILQALARAVAAQYVELVGRHEQQGDAVEALKTYAAAAAAVDLSEEEPL